MCLGGKGVISVAANIAPKPMSEMVGAMLKERWRRQRHPLGMLSERKEGRLRKVLEMLEMIRYWIEKIQIKPVSVERISV